MNWFRECGLASVSGIIPDEKHACTVIASFKENRKTLESDEHKTRQGGSPRPWKGPFNSEGENWIAHYWRPFESFTHFTCTNNEGNRLYLPWIIGIEQYRALTDIRKNSTPTIAQTIVEQLTDLLPQREGLFLDVLLRIRNAFTDDVDVLKFDGFCEENFGAELRFTTTTGGKTFSLDSPHSIYQTSNG